MSGEPCLPRTVKPRRPHTQTPLPIVAVAQEDLEFSDHNGNVRSLEEFPSFIATAPPSLVVGTNIARLLLSLDRFFGDDEEWQFRVGPIRQDVLRPNGLETGVKITGTVVHFFGWRKKGKKGRWHFPLDPTVFVRKTAHELYPDTDGRLTKLLRFGREVQEFCQSNDLRPSPTGGGLAGQLLKDPRFYPEPRRKVPRKTNARARLALPGNFYALNCQLGRSYQATYIDMHAAHHTCASQIHFPDANRLVARGRFAWEGEEFADGTWARSARAADRVLRGYGLLYVTLKVPKIPASQFPPPYMAHHGVRDAWIFTNELPMVRELGGIILDIRAAWTSYTRDTGINRYAEWALSEIERERDKQGWLKPTLLATYGVLASRPRVREFAYKRATGGQTRQYPAGSGMLTAQAKISLTEQEVPVVNVIHRGMIEAECRMQASQLARWLAGYGCHVLAVYADSVFVDSRHPLPLVPPPWRVKADLSRLVFHSPVAFTSNELDRLPGVPREVRDRVSRLRAYQELMRKVPSDPTARVHPVGDA